MLGQDTPQTGSRPNVAMWMGRFGAVVGWEQWPDNESGYAVPASRPRADFPALHIQTSRPILHANGWGGLLRSVVSAFHVSSRFS